MASIDKNTETLRGLRELALTDFRGAVALAVLIFSDSKVDASGLLEEMDGLDFGRARQAVVMAALQSELVLRRVQGALERWAEDEKDEFARRALNRMLQQRPDRSTSKETARGGDQARQQLLVYRYIAERLAHRVGNAFMSVDGRVESLRLLIPQIEDAAIRRELDSFLSDLNIRVKALGHAVGYPVHDQHFEVQVFDWPEYLQQASARYSNQFPGARIKVTHDPSLIAKVKASDFYLYTICWNIWINSQQATTDEPMCEIEVTLTSRSPTDVTAVFSDNGAGFPLGFMSDSRVFLWPSSTTPERRRGRGLIEVAEAVDRLGGSICVETTSDGTRRLVVTLPVAKGLSK